MLAVLISERLNRNGEIFCGRQSSREKLQRSSFQLHTRFDILTRVCSFTYERVETFHLNVFPWKLRMCVGCVLACGWRKIKYFILMPRTKRFMSTMLHSFRAILQIFFSHYCSKTFTTLFSFSSSAADPPPPPDGI